MIIALASRGLDAPRLDADGFPLPPSAVARFGSSRFNSGYHIHGLITSADGKNLATDNFGGSCVWDAKTGRLLFRSARYSSQSLGFAPGDIFDASHFRPGELTRVRVVRGGLLDPFRLESEYGRPAKPLVIERFDLRTRRTLSDSSELLTSHRDYPSSIAAQPALTAPSGSMSYTSLLKMT